jgi:hypothetical protein
MAGLDPAPRLDGLFGPEDADARHKAGHDVPIVSIPLS